MKAAIPCPRPQERSLLAADWLRPAATESSWQPAANHFSRLLLSFQASCVFNVNKGKDSPEFSINSLYNSFFFFGGGGLEREGEEAIEPTLLFTQQPQPARVRISIPSLRGGWGARYKTPQHPGSWPGWAQGAGEGEKGPQAPGEGGLWDPPCRLGRDLNGPNPHSLRP